MPHSLRARLSGLRYKKIISDKDYDRLCKALDNENVLDKIKTEIEENAYPIVHGINNHEKGMTLYGVLQIIDKYKAEDEPQESEEYLPKYEAKVITRGNCMMCGKELTEGLFFCKECGAKAESEVKHDTD